MCEFIRTDNLSFTYRDGDGAYEKTPALFDVNTAITSGEYIAVLGHNGSGKSTFAKLLNMILLPTGGALTVDGKTFRSGDDVSEDDIYGVRKKVGMVFQNPDNQLVATIVEEDVAFGPENLGVEPSEIRRRVDAALKTVGMNGYERHSTNGLSGGQKQRIAIAGVIAMKPQCIIFDESTAMLDPLGRHEVMGAIRKLNREENMTVIQITHYMEEAVLADRVIVIDDGHPVLDGTPAEVFSDVKRLHTLGLEAPQGAELAEKLRDAGIEIDGNCIDPDECAEIICKLLENGK